MTFVDSLASEEVRTLGEMHENPRSGRPQVLSQENKVDALLRALKIRETER